MADELAARRNKLATPGTGAFATAP
jgi:hypothetical protein